MLLERLAVNAIGRPTPVPSEAHQADLEQVILPQCRSNKLICATFDTALFASQTQLQFETSGNLWPEPGDSLQELKVATPHEHRQAADLQLRPKVML